MEEDDEIVPSLTCDVELEVTGPTWAVVNKWTADALRKLADRVEKGELDTGFHPVNDGSGKPIGQIYLDHHGEPI